MSAFVLSQNTLRLRPMDITRRRPAPVRLPPGRTGMRFTEIETANRRWDLFGMSAGAQVVILLALAWLPILYIRAPEPVEYSLTLLTKPVTEYEPPQRKPLPPAREVKPVPVEQAVVKPQVPDTRLAAPRPRRREVRPVEAPQLAAVVRPAEMELGRQRNDVPRPPVVTGLLESRGSSAQPTIQGRRVDQVQTGGFGDPNGVPATGRPDKAPNINRVGSAGLPPGYGYGNGTGGTRGARGVVTSAGFGNGVAQGNPGARSSSGRGGVASTGFGDAAPSAGGSGRPSPVAAQPAKSDRIPVEILHKPNPSYTEQARQKRIEGNVKLRVIFTAAGELRILGVLQGLGHGLDEAAVSAAQKIRFRPARENGRPVDEPAIVTIEFKLAY
jgi:TonB family protein